MLLAHSGEALVIVTTLLSRPGHKAPSTIFHWLPVCPSLGLSPAGDRILCLVDPAPRPALGATDEMLMSDMLGGCHLQRQVSMEHFLWTENCEFKHSVESFPTCSKCADVVHWSPWHWVHSSRGVVLTNVTEQSAPSRGLRHPFLVATSLCFLKPFLSETLISLFNRKGVSVTCNQRANS